ncbi:MAG: acylphosphatase [Chloroflexi bacterium]|nr:MAG: acylphosphatase [Chloroflexota bacterium]
MAETDEQLHAIVSGRVQGVSYRYYTMMTATEMGLTGWVKNTDDGNVEVVAEGPRPVLEKFLAFLHEGSPAAKVKNVDVKWRKAKGKFKGFVTRYESNSTTTR